MFRPRCLLFLVPSALLIAPTIGFGQDPYTLTVLADEPVAMYSFVSGPGATSVIDITGNGHDSKSMSGNVEIVPGGPVGDAALFSLDPDTDTGGSIVVDLQLSLADPEGDGINAGLNDFTLEALVSPLEINRGAQVFLAQKDGTGLGRSNALITANDFWGSFTGGSTSNSGTIPVEDEWYHYVFSFDGDGGADAVKFYINGELSGEPTALRPAVNGLPEDADGDWVIGSHKNEGIQFFIGLVDEVAFYDYRIDDPNGDDDTSDSLVMSHFNAAFPDTVSCDFNGDSTCDLADLDELQYQGLGSADLKYDLDGSGTIDLDDTAEWLTQAVASAPGDANLDGTVDVADLNAVGLNWQSDNVSSWARGDFNGDGRVGAADLNTLGVNWQFGAAAAAVPEPSSAVLLLLAVACVLRKRLAP